MDMVLPVAVGGWFWVCTMALLWWSTVHVGQLDRECVFPLPTDGTGVMQLLVKYSSRRSSFIRRQDECTSLLTSPSTIFVPLGLSFTDFGDRTIPRTKNTIDLYSVPVLSSVLV